MKRGIKGAAAALAERDADCTIFAAAYFVTAALSFNSLTAGSLFIKILAGLIMLWGAAALVRRLYGWKYIAKDWLFRLSLLFFVSAAVSSLINVKYGLEGSVKMLVWMAFELFLLAARTDGEYPAPIQEPTEGGMAVSGGAGRLTTDDRHNAPDARPGERSGHARRVMFSVVFAVTFCQSLISVAMLVAGYSGAAIERGQYIGLQLGRLWGCYSDPNYGSVLACCSMAISIGELSRRLLLFRQDSRPERGRLHGADPMVVLLALNVGLQYIYIVFSFSRTGQICLAMELLVFAYLAASADLKNGMNAVRKAGEAGSNEEASFTVHEASRTVHDKSWKKALWVAVFVMILILAGPAMDWLRSGYNMMNARRGSQVSGQQAAQQQEVQPQAVQQEVQPQAVQIQAGQAQTAQPQAVQIQTAQPQVASHRETQIQAVQQQAARQEVLGAGAADLDPAGAADLDPAGAAAIFREDIAEGGLTNGRIDIWKEGVLIWRDNPIFGISYRNIPAYTRTNYPDGYMTTRENELNTFHNMFVDILVSQGLAGCLTALAMACVVAARTFTLLRDGEAGGSRSRTGKRKSGTGDGISNRLYSVVPAVLVITIGLSALALTEIFYINTPTAVLFWYCLSLLPAARNGFGSGRFTGLK
jgi:hypothetical protein